MLASLKSELRKIWTVRSTYFILIFAVLLIGLFAFWSEGIKAGSNSVAVTDSHKLANLFAASIANLALFGALVGILSFTHEYRYNTIMYTLTNNKSRTRSWFAKLLAVTMFSLLFTVFVSLLAVGAMYLGLAFKGLTLVHQIFPLSLLWRVVFVGWGFSMFGFILAAIIRQQVGAMAAFFLIPSLGEQLLSLLLKHHSVYLPFTALMRVTTSEPASADSRYALSPGKAALVVSAYLVGGWIISWYLFLRRDAN